MQDNVGTIVIGTKVNTKGATKDIEKLYQQVEREQEKIERLLERKQSLEIRTDKFEKKLTEAQKKVDNLYQGMERLATEQLSLDNIPINEKNIKLAMAHLQQMDLSKMRKTGPDAGRATEFRKLTEEYFKQNDIINNTNTELDLIDKKYNRINQEIVRAEQNQTKLNQKLNEATGKKGLSTEDFKEGIGKIEKGFGGIVKKVFRLGLALIGIRTIINLITRSFNTLAEYNTELGTKMEQMRLVLAVALEPVINWIVSMLQVILSLVNQIMSTLFGLNLFGRANELWSKKMAKNMASGAGSAKEMKKQLAGFDEMNVLNDNQASGGGGGGASGIDPWMLENKPIPEWMKWILKNGSLIAGIISGIAVAVLLLKLGISGLLALGIGVLVAGIVMLIIDIIDYLKDPTWEKFGNIIRDIGVILIGIGIIIGGIPGLVVAIIGAIVLLVGVIIKYWDQIKAWILGIGDWFHQQGEKFKKDGQGWLGGIFELISKTIDDIVYIFEWLVDTAKTIFDGIIDFLKKVFAGDWKGAWESIKDTAGKVWDKIKDLVSKSWERMKENFKLGIEVIKDLHNKLVMWLAEKILYIDAYVRNIIANVINWIVDKFNIVTNFFKGIGIAIGDFFSSAIKTAVNGALSWIESKVNWFIDKINGVIGWVNNLPIGVHISKLSRISLPRLATGGIINQPGRGVPVGGAIAGESGREGILPLTDKQAMEQLGREIGKWISIQATVPVNIGNRQIARVIQELNNDREFAMNS